MKKKYQWLIFFFGAIFLFSGIDATAQGSCDDLIITALQNYKEGHYQKVIMDLEQGLESCKLPNEEKEEALKLLASANYQLDEIERGDNYMVKFFKKDANHIPQKGIDPAPFVSSFTKFNISPRFVVSGGFSIPRYEYFRTKIYKIWPKADYSQKYTSTLFPIFMAGAQWYPFRNFSLALGVQYTEMTFMRNITDNESIKINYEEGAKILSIPLHLGYDIRINKRIYPTLYVGFSYIELLEIDADISREFILPASSAIPPIMKTNGLDLSKQRNTQNISLDLGIRLNYKMNNFIVFGDFRLSKLGLEYSNGEKYTNPSVLLNYYYMDDDFTYEQMNFSFGVAYIFSNRVKLKY